MEFNSRLQNVFIAVRTNFFEVPDEHMTVKYFKDIDYNSLLMQCKALIEHLPVVIELDRPSSWEAGDEQYNGWLIKHNTSNPIFPAMPHITIPEGFTQRPEKGRSWIQTHKTLFIGKRYRNKPHDIGYIDWLRVNNNGLDAERAFRLGYEKAV